MLVTGTIPAALCRLQHRCLLLGSSQRGEVFSAKDHLLFPQLPPASLSPWRRGAEGGSHSPSICSVLHAAAPSTEERQPLLQQHP